MKKQLGFWGLGLVCLVGFLLSFAEFYVLERQYQTVKAEHDAQERQMYEIGMGWRETGGFDIETYLQLDREYWAAYRARFNRRYSPESMMIVFGIGLFLWFLALMGRGITRAAQWSAAREERREQEKGPWE